MTHFVGLADDVVGIVLVGAEGCAEVAEVAWVRDATREELQLFRTDCH